MSSPTEKSKTPKPKSKQSYAAPRFLLPLVDFSLIPLSLHLLSLPTDLKKEPHSLVVQTFSNHSPQVPLQHPSSLMPCPQLPQLLP